ncbi:hypothetical protein QP431_02535 [Actinotignum sanguinis]|uniref:hypothetical protein n=1 Tax=Actinotignum sanguinis TaxID=1445614 RepID=UPI000F7F315E|nr:hypothetical protein [Actinotignum sanguinis]MDK7197079.1 hypothetical protein [Actinotignum sanguinis]MDY5148982.1 hypothetical protein [Actinotignum sanguinis]
MREMVRKVAASTAALCAAGAGALLLGGCDAGETTEAGNFMRQAGASMYVVSVDGRELISKVLDCSGGESQVMTGTFEPANNIVTWKDIDGKEIGTSVAHFAEDGKTITLADEATPNAGATYVREGSPEAELMARGQKSECAPK